MGVFSLPPSVRAAWEYVFTYLFCEKTNLVYDYRTGDGPDGAFRHLPTAEEIALLIPSPTGTSTGMEDGPLNGGVLIEAALGRATLCGDEEAISAVRKLCRGFLDLAACANRPGFIPRSRLPLDGKSHYINSSRDQFTHWVYGAYRLYQSPHIDEKTKNELRECVADVARLAKHDVVPENGYSFLRDDGLPGRTMEMWGELSPHEYMRLPMFYAAAWSMTGDDAWHREYLHYRDEALEKSKPVDHSSLWHVYCSQQMQVSLRLCYDVDEDAGFRNDCLALMRSCAAYYTPYVFRRAQALSAPAVHEDLCWRYEDWRRVPAVYQGIIGGRPYYVHDQITGPAHYPLRDLGNAVSCVSLCPGADTTGMAEAIVGVMDNIDFSRHYTGGPIDLLAAYFISKCKTAFYI